MASVHQISLQNQCQCSHRAKLQEMSVISGPDNDHKHSQLICPCYLILQPPQNQDISWVQHDYCSLSLHPGRGVLTLTRCVLFYQDVIFTFTHQCVMSGHARILLGRRQRKTPDSAIHIHIYLLWSYDFLDMSLHIIGMLVHARMWWLWNNMDVIW